MRPNIPQLVYNFALKRDLTTLRELQTQGHCLTQFYHEFHVTDLIIAHLLGTTEANSEKIRFNLHRLFAKQLNLGKMQPSGASPQPALALKRSLS